MKKTLYFLASLLVISCGGAEETPSSTTKKKETNNSVFENTGSDLENKSTQPNETYTIEDTISIKLTPFVAKNDEIGASGIKLLKDRLNSGITKIGFGGDGSNPRFIIGPSISLVSKNITSTAPTKYANTYEINLMVVDVVTETIFTSWQTVFKGVGDSPEKAFLSGIRNIKFEGAEFIEFLVAAEQKIISFFDERCSSILDEANAAAKMRSYDEAYSMLKSIPAESKTCFADVQTKKLEFFQLALNKNCNENLAKMKAELGKFNDESASGFNAEAMNYYSMIDSESECYEEAQREYNNYISKLNPKAKRDWNQKIKEYNDQIAMVKAEKEFAREEAQLAYDFKIKMAEEETKREVEGNRKLLAKYKYDDSPWLIRLFSSGAKLMKGEMNTK
ncbi:MAG: hypothetical protein VX756_04875 [Bacteroidota bacterium]|nr:hypothetical protein [Bacteroidota bacterium]